MRLTLFSFGSRGDSEPLAALAVALARAGDAPTLVTGCREHTTLGFPARLWSDAFPLAGAFAGRRTMGRREAGERLLLHAPVVLWGLVLLAVHALTAPLWLAASGAHRRVRTLRSFGELPSAVDRVMLLDAMLRSHWRRATTRSRWVLGRWFGTSGVSPRAAGRVLDLIWRALDGAEVAVIAEGTDDLARERMVLFLAARRGIPCVRVSFFPRDLTPTPGYPAWLVASAFPATLPWLCRWPRLANPASFLLAWPLAGLFAVLSQAHGVWYRASERLLLRRPGLLQAVNAWLAERGEEAVTWRQLAAPDYRHDLTPWSPALLPAGRGDGFWQLAPPAGWTPPADLTAFLEPPGPVVFVSRIARSTGFQPILAQVLDHAPPCRWVVNLPPEEALPALAARSNVAFVGDVPHAWLLARCTAAIHHGGAGTTAAVLGAGLPALVVPTWGDQSLWAQRVYGVGCGPLPVHVRWVNAVNLGAALGRLLADPALAATAAPWRERLAAERGLEVAAAALRGWGQR